ncbi:1542_t:CDS:2, partial [Racocetra persica]
GYDGSKPLISITNHPNINIHYMSHPWKLPDKLPKLLFLNPPSIPTLMITQFVCWARQANLIIDWHNFGFTILGMRLGHNSRIVKIAK